MQVFGEHTSQCFPMIQRQESLWKSQEPYEKKLRDLEVRVAQEQRQGLGEPVSVDQCLSSCCSSFSFGCKFAIDAKGVLHRQGAPYRDGPEFLRL